MRPWIHDANSIKHQGHFDKSIVHFTPSIENFLHPQEDDCFFVIATKGFGKTFLLKSKRMLCGKSGTRWLPENDLIDKPGGSVRNFSWEDVAKIIGDRDYWTNIWMLSVTCAVLRQRVGIGAELKSDKLRSIFLRGYDNIQDYFANLLDMDMKQYYVAVSDLRATLSPEYRSYHSQVMAFIDNVDEYFHRHESVTQSLESNQDIIEKEICSAGVLDKELWYGSQEGLVIAALTLHEMNPHVKIYFSIRKEAYSKLVSKTDLSLQIAGSALHIKYDSDDLFSIFCKNIEVEKPGNLVCAWNAEAPLKSFLGEELLRIRHQYTGTIEEVWSYILRHTLGRPRDLMRIGKLLSEIPPRKRNAESIRKAVNDAGTEIANEYRLEVAPHIHPIDWNLLFSIIPSNVVESATIRNLSGKYASMSPDGYGHVFCTMYKVGLLGFVDRPPNGNFVQKFALPGELTFEDDGILPPSDYYIFHPILDELIRNGSVAYRKGYNKWSVPGNGLPWIPPMQTFAVAKGDIVGYSTTVMSNPDLSRNFPRYFSDALSSISDHLRCSYKTEGDSFIIVDENPLAVWDAIKRLRQALRMMGSSLVFRVGADYGFVSFEDAPPGAACTVDSSQPVRMAGRIERVAPPDSLLASERFVRRCTELGGAERWQQLVENDLPLPFENGAFDLRKNETDAPTSTSLYRLDLN